MKKLLAKIRKILKDRRTRQLLTRIVSITAAVVVFITTYALVLPAITMESEANCGIPAHQHDDSCYEDRLICGQVESPGHQHTDACYSISKSLICTETEHQHDDSCFDEDGNLTCELAEHTHDDSCYEEVRELVCDIPESEGHEHTDDCYERVLACGMEAHTHSTACYSHGSELTASAPSDFAAVATTELGSYGATVSASAETDTNSEETSNTWASDESAAGGLSSTAAGAAATDYSSTATAADTASTGFDAATAEDAFVPQLEPIIVEQLLTKDTGIYYYHAEEGEEDPENSVDIADWKRVNDDTELAPADLLRVYLRYTIPAGALNATNDIARYRLPSNLHLTDQQMEAINTTVNGIANQYVNLDTLEITDTERYNTYLGIEATEGTRKPSDDIDEYFTNHPDMEAQEFINAVVRAENVFDETTEEYLGQDLVFTFTPYTVQKNQHEYDAEGQPTKAGQKVNGWLCFDLHMDQIDWSEPVISTIEDPAAPAQDVATENTEDTYSSDTTEATEKVASDMDEDASLSSSNPYELNTNTITEKKESSAEIVFAAKDEIRTEIHLVEFNTIEKENDAAQDEPDQSADESTDNANSEMTDGKDDIADDSNPEGEADKPESANEPATDTENQPESAMEINAETYPAVSFEDTITVQAGTLSTDNENAAKDTLAETAITVSVIAEEETFPLGTTMQLGTVEDMDTVASAVEGAVEGQTRGFHAVDISFHNADGEEIEPLKPIKVSMTSDAIKQAVEDSSTAPVVVHIESPAEPVNPSEHENTTSSDESNDLSNNRTDAVENTEDLDAHHDSVTETSENTPTATIVEIAETSDTDRENGSEDNTDTLTFDAGSFSVYVIVYTVDFHWEVNGKQYQLRLPGGGFVSFEALMEIMGVAKKDVEDSEQIITSDGSADADVEVIQTEDMLTINDISISEETKAFVRDVESVVFSTPEYVWVGKASLDSTVGWLKEANALDVVYSAELTEDQIAEINAQTVEAGDWALISVRPFTSEESLTVTMKNGEQFVVLMTDAQDDPLGLDGKAFAIVNTKNGTSTAMKPVISNNRLQGDSVTLSQNEGILTCSDNASYWVFEAAADGKYYIKSGDLYLKISGTNNSDWKIELVEREDADPITIVQNGEKYRFLNDDNISINNYGGTFWAGNWNNDDEWMMLRTPYDPNKPAERVTVDSRVKGLTINLFDYGPDDGTYNLDKEDNHLDGSNVDDYSDQGINQYSGLKFFSYGTGYGEGTCGINNFTGSSPNEKAAQGIVQNTLINGYPSLQNDESLDYLFDMSSRSGKTIYSNVNHLFWDENGKLKYDSDESYAYYNQGTKDFKVYNTTYEEEGSSDTATFKVGFFPFNDYDARYQCIHGDDFNWGCTGSQSTHGVSDEVGHFNHHFGLSMTGTFEIVKNQDMTFNFSGDDDLWVFVDDVLVLDIGGIHNPIDGSIDFGTTDGSVSVSPDVVAIDDNETYLAPDTIKAAFEKAGKTWDGSGGTYHEIKVFYLERGGMYSNLEMEINLPLVPSGNLTFNKKDDNAAALPGATFTLYTNPECTHPLSYKSEECVAVADENGVVTFSGVPVGSYYMKEISAPVGYDMDTTVYGVLIKDRNYPEQGASFISKPDGTVVSDIVNAKRTVAISLEKEWVGGVPAGATATFALKRNCSYEGDIIRKSTLKIYRVPSGWDHTQAVLEETKEFKGDTTATVTWSFDDYMGEFWKNNPQYQIDDGAVQSPSSAIASVSMPSTGEVSLYILDGNMGGDYSQYRVRITNVNGTVPGTDPEHVSVSNEPDTQYNADPPTYTFPVGTTNWTYAFPAQDAMALRTDGLVETYTYYIEEISHSPSNWNVAYSTDALSENGTIRVTNFKNEVYVVKRWYDPNGTLLTTQPTDSVSVTLSSANGGQISGDATKSITAQNKGIWSVSDSADIIYTAVENPVPTAYDVSYSFQDAGEAAERSSGGVHRGGTIYVNNKQKIGSLEITKSIQKNGTVDTSATGTFYYAVYDEEYNANADPAQTPVRTGSIEVTENGTNSVTENELLLGTYYVYELTGEGGTPIVSGSEGVRRAIADTVYQVTGSGTTAVVGESTSSVTLTNNKETVNVEVEKNWQDNNNAKGNRPSELKVTLSNGTEVTLNSNNNWKAAINGLPKYNSEGQLIVYTWTEETIGNGYTLIGTSIDSVTGADGVVTETTTLTNGPDEHYNPTTSFTGTKTWNDDGSIRPDEIEIILYKGEGAQKEEVERKTLEKKEDGSNLWTFDFTNIPVFDGQGNVINYSVEEVLPNGYTCSLSTSAPGYERDESNDQVFVNEPNAEVNISTGVNLGFIVIKHGNDFIIWTPRKASEAELAEIKQKVAGQAIGDSEFSQILSRPSENVYGVPNNDIKKGNMTASIYMDGDTVKVHFGNKNWSQLAWGQLAYTYTPGNADLINTQTITSLEFYKKWINSSGEEFDWDNDIQVTVRRNGDNSFSLVYNLAKTDIVNGNTINPTPNNDGNPKIKVSVTENEGVKTYLFTIDGLDYANENNEKYIYTVTETNAQLDGYIAPSYSNTSAPTGATAAYDKGTIINQQAGVELPSTGGPGTNLIYLLGIMLTGLAGTGLVMKRRRRNAA